MRLKNTFMLVLLAGCDQGSPPFDQLPLRDALRAAPEVIASLPESARIQLAVRLEAACAKDVAIDELPSSTTSTPAATVVALDRMRQHRQSEPLIIGVFSNEAAWAIRDCATAPGAPVLPPIEGTPAVATAAMEILALGSEAGEAVRALLAASGAHHVHRVVGWPAGAVAIDDTVYVNASWLVSLAPAGNEKMDGGADGGAIAGSASPGVIAPAGAVNPSVGGSLPDQEGTSLTWKASAVPKLRGALPSGDRGDAGVVQPPSGYDPQPPAGGDSADACVQCAAGCDTDSGDSCDSGDDPCAASSDDGSGDSSDPCASPAEASDGSSADACANTSDDDAAACSGAGEGADAASCQVSRGRGHKNSGTRIWLCVPLAFLLFWRRP